MEYCRHSNIEWVVKSSLAVQMVVDYDFINLEVNENKMMVLKFSGQERFFSMRVSDACCRAVCTCKEM